MRTITSVPKDLSWEDFSKQFANFFPISDPKKRDKKLQEEYKRLTGKEPNNGETKRLGRKGKSFKGSGNGGSFASNSSPESATGRKSEH